MPAADPRQHAYARFVVAHALITERMEAALAAAGLPSLDWYDVLWVLESSREERLRSERPVDGRLGVEAESRYAAHELVFDSVDRTTET